ncbi:M56 family metallopeptidase [Kangiella sp. HZ709]|uniref:M56 family metallopeptidase n=1 Tax=Kangiella sp. HZ709 TaxID=2666328 RepID=UPI0012AF27C5|nr:M56 family metallopeptidase [Kangiella sp. HZ709]MRX28456.1 hypothetical protein [Kangiella sp. HZ709]
MNELIAYLWQFNIELSLLLCVILVARLVIRKTTKNYNAYLLWLSIPIGLLVAKLLSFIEFEQAPQQTINFIITNYVVEPSQQIDSWNYLLYIWGSISVLLIIRLLKQHKMLRKDLNKIIVPHHLSFKTKYPIVGIDKEGFSPAVYGFIKPKIYFPVQLEKQLSQEQIRLIIKHEEHHISQKHLWLNLLWDILVCFMWFNPLVYLSRQNFRHDQEVYCDYLVLNRAPEPDHKSYGHALLSTVSATHSVSLLCSWKMFNQLEERIMSIKNVKRKSNKIALAIGAAAIIGCTSLYAINMNQFQQHPNGQHSEHKVEWTIDGESYVQENGQWKLYKNGKARVMTSAEQRKFEKHVQMAEEEMRRFEEEMKISEQEVELAEAEMQEIMEEAERVHAEMALSFEEMQEAYKELEFSQLKLQTDYLEGNLSKKEAQKVQLELKEAHKELQRTQSLRQKEMMRAKQQLERSRKEILKGQSGLRFPPPPKAPKPAQSKFPRLNEPKS